MSVKRWDSIPAGPGPTHTSLLAFTDALGDGKSILQSATNLYPKDPENPPPVYLPAELRKLIDRLAAEGAFLEPWTGQHDMHSEVAILSEIAYDKKKEREKEGKNIDEVIELGQPGMELPKHSEAIISTTHFHVDDPDAEPKQVRSCMNCTVLLNTLGIRDVNGGLEEERRTD